MHKLILSLKAVIHNVKELALTAFVLKNQGVSFFFLIMLAFGIGVARLKQIFSRNR